MPVIGAKITSTTERVYRASTFSRATQTVEKRGPVNRSGSIGKSAAMMTAKPRGILRQTNVRGISSPIDKINSATAQSAAKVKKKSEAVTESFNQQLTGKGDSVNAKS